MRGLKKWDVVLCKKQKCTEENGTFHFKLKEDDINLAIDALSDAYENKCDKVILISSDMDFVPLVRQLKKIGKEVCLYYFENLISKRFLDMFDDKNKNKITKSIIKRHFLKQ